MVSRPCIRVSRYKQALVPCLYFRFAQSFFKNFLEDSYSHPSQFPRLPGCTEQDMVLASLKLGTHIIFTQVEAQLLIHFKCAAAVVSVRHRGLDLVQNPISRLVGGFRDDSARSIAVYKAPSSHCHQRHYLKRSSTSTLCSCRVGGSSVELRRPRLCRLCA